MSEDIDSGFGLQDHAVGVESEEFSLDFSGHGAHLDVNLNLPFNIFFEDFISVDQVLLKVLFKNSDSERVVQSFESDSFSLNPL